MRAVNSGASRRVRVCKLHSSRKAVLYCSECCYRRNIYSEQQSTALMTVDAFLIQDAGCINNALAVVAIVSKVKLLYNMGLSKKGQGHSLQYSSTFHHGGASVQQLSSVL